MYIDFLSMLSLYRPCSLSCSNSFSPSYISHDPMLLKRKSAIKQFSAQSEMKMIFEPAFKGADSPSLTLVDPINLKPLGALSLEVFETF